MKKYILVFTILLIILSGCNRNAAEMITDGKVIINKEDSTVTFKGMLTDRNLDADTPFQARFFLQGGTIRNALGKDLIYTDKELKSDSDLKKSEEYEVETTIELKQPDKIDELIKAIKDKDEKVVTIEVINDNGRLDDKVIHKVEEK
ncbi:membrane lipoprotein lipid attachment site-containing protein [[Bacillus] enclensis]|uniref:membrane lipoprotein lipid attachment site-containing protein n=1 Tax=[Bacillus] enclensis TaxID=1402860 RepID=UPI0018DD3469|nr:membrane lipoprotein lipid attachment site-containing protein [[Bacillus] enclensis]MBH9964687.1 membrane lipoprotein lipid attachment site-containing protein [[Bacillus] enclensis]